MSKKAVIDPISLADFRDHLVATVEQCMDKPSAIDKSKTWRQIWDTQNPPAHALKFTNILGSTTAQWWLLYINPKDWQKALQKYPQDPGKLYGSDKPEEKNSKDFRVAMERAYQKHLVDGSLAEGILNTDFGWDDYLAVYLQATASEQTGGGDAARSSGANGQLETNKKSGGGSNKEDDHYGNRESTHVTFPTNVKTAADAQAEELIFNAAAEEDAKKLVEMKLKLIKVFKQNDMDAKFNCFGCYFPPEQDEQVVLHCHQPLEINRPAVTKAFQEFRTQIGAAQTIRARLTTIARLIRRLHIIHAFKDGCGRTNVFLFLPALLLHFGFGLTLGGQNATHLDRRAIDQLFNGGYSLDEIAKYLLVAQDFGFEDSSKSSVVSLSQHS